MHQAVLRERKLMLLLLFNHLQPNPAHFSVILKRILPLLMFFFYIKQYLISKSHINRLYVHVLSINMPLKRGLKQRSQTVAKI